MLASVPEFIDLTPEMKERLDRFQEDHKNDPLGGVGGRITFEDERVRICIRARWSNLFFFCPTFLGGWP